MKYKYKKMIFAASASIMLLGMVVFSTRTNFTDKKKQGNAGQVSSGAVTESDNIVSGSAAGEEILKQSSVSSEDTQAVATSTLLKDAYPEVNKLITAHLNAKASGDIDALAATVDSIDYIDTDDIKKRADAIESIGGIVCYTLDGPEKDAYMVYACNEVKLKGIKTAASSLDGFYVRTDENGDLKIVAGPLEDSIQAIIDQDVQRSDVRALLSDVNTKLAKEINNDADLKKYYENLGADKNSEGTEPVSEEEKNTDEDKKSDNDKTSKKTDSKVGKVSAKNSTLKKTIAKKNNKNSINRTAKAKKKKALGRVENGRGDQNK